jgi:hypothetical protein
LLRVKELAEEKAGSLQRLSEDIDCIDAIAGEVGGYERLKKCIAFWKNLETKGPLS